MEQLEEDYEELFKTAVGGAAGVIHAVDCATTDCQPNGNVEALRVFMLAKKIEYRPVWKPMHKQPVYEVLLSIQVVWRKTCSRSVSACLQVLM